MQRFIESLDITSEAKFMDVQDVIERCAATSEFNASIVEEALHRIAKVREARV
jgi:hypothetical protein